MNDDLPATRSIRQLTIRGSLVRVRSSNALFLLVKSSIILLELELSGESARRYDMCFCLLIALCRFFLKYSKRHANTNRSSLCVTRLRGIFLLLRRERVNYGGVWI